MAARDIATRVPVYLGPLNGGVVLCCLPVRLSDPLSTCSCLCDISMPPALVQRQRGEAARGAAGPAACCVTKHAALDGAIHRDTPGGEMSTHHPDATLQRRSNPPLVCLQQHPSIHAYGHPSVYMIRPHVGFLTQRHPSQLLKAAHLASCFMAHIHATKASFPWPEREYDSTRCG